MSKRKILAGGYAGSSDDEFGDSERELMAIPLGQSNNKKHKVSQPMLPRLNLPSQVGNGFKYPGMAISPHASAPRSFSVSSSRQDASTPEPATSSQSTGSTAPDVTPTIRFPINILEDTSSGISSEVDEVTSNQLRSERGTGGHLKVPQAQTGHLGGIRTFISLERQANELATSLNDHIRTSNEQHQLADEKLARILDVIEKLASPTGGGVLPTAPPTTTNPPSASELANPKPTPELIEIISRVVSEARSRIGKKKGGPEENSRKEHTRGVFYRLFDMTAAKSVRPHFEDEHGEPDTLPSQFVNPATGYCQPFPHWKAPLTKQVAWVPTFLMRFRATIPNNGSELSAKLQALTDEEIIILLHDGPFKSAQTAWRDMKKTDEELAQMQAQARRYQRVERKALTRASYVRTIPSLQGSEWEYLSHSGYMSAEESDSEGELITSRPDHRSQWENNLFEAIRIAELKRTRNRLGSHYQPPPRHVVSVKRPIPHLERGNGGNKVTVRIAVCGFGKYWRAENEDYFKKQAHLIDFKVTTKPNIDDFLEQHPQLDDRTNVQDSGEATNVEEQDLDKVDGLVDGPGDINAAVGFNHVRVNTPIDPQLQDEPTWVIVDADGRPSPTGLPIHDNPPVQPALPNPSLGGNHSAHGPGLTDLASGPNHAQGEHYDVPIDPRLQDHTWEMVQANGRPSPGDFPIHNNLPAQPSALPNPSFDERHPAHGPPMPPPPLPPLGAELDPTVTSAAPPAKRRGRPPKNSNPDNEARILASGSQSAETPQPKKRGRPPKNSKPTKK